MVLCKCGTYGIGVHVVLCACHTCHVEGMRYYICASSSLGILTCLFVMLYYVYVYVLCCTSRLGICIVLWCTSDVGACIVSCCTLGVGVCVLCQVYVDVLHGVVCCVWLYVPDAHYVYVHIVEEKALSVCQAWKPIQSVYGLKDKSRG